jgi:hypothetical protein
MNGSKACFLGSSSSGERQAAGQHNFAPSRKPQNSGAGFGSWCQL